MTTAERIRDEALSLTDEERAELAEALFESLYGPEDEDEELDAKVAARAERVMSGTARIRDWSEVEAEVARIKEQLH